MFYVDTQRTTTRRDSSLVTTARSSPDGDSVLTARGPSSAHFDSESTNSTNARPKGSVQRELVTLLFESMLKHIVETWEVIVPDKPDVDNIEKTVSEITILSTKKKGKESVKSAKSKAVDSRRSKSGSVPIEPVSWWSGPDERAIIRFKNGNLYEGNISMKCMHGEGRFQWVDGTVYLGHFKNNEMTGKGFIQWKDDTWYEGDFMGNLRHGRGLYVNSRTQGSYVGDWHLGTKHGIGAIYYSRSFTNSYDGQWVHIEPVSWWSGPDERAIIRFKNGNLYEGNISMKCMHGEGRFQWVDGTVYLGHFKNNEMTGKGFIQWKDDTWYEGDFMGNLRHGRGLYVNSRTQGSYVGDWHLGTKHGIGAIYYSRSFTNSYDGQWVHNVRHGLGSREYSHDSGYKGEWDAYTREGKGLMIWPNHDFYSGEWKNNVMSGFGVYIWDMYCNNSMSMPSINIYRGEWYKGKRNGYGVLSFGFGLGSHYKGEFKDNLKHGHGKLVTNNGQIFQHKALFIDDNLGPHVSECEASRAPNPKQPQVQEPIQFDLCDSNLGLIYHIHQALNNIDRQAEVRGDIIAKFFDDNKYHEFDVNATRRKDDSPKEEHLNIEDLIDFEEASLRKALRCYETDIRNIYFHYAKICNTDEINFTPNLIRLYLWQLYFDCNIHEKGLTLVQIDNLFFKNSDWIALTPHNPFEKVYFWQFQHSLITVASKLYAKTQFPGPKPDTMLASAFRTFMDNDVLPGSKRHKGHLVDGCGVFVPLKALYALYRSLGEPHTVREFLCAALRPHHDLAHPQPPMVNAPDHCLPIGRNAYVFEDDMTFTVEEHIEECVVENPNADASQLRLFNFGNMSCRDIIKIFSKIFPHVFGNSKVLDLNVEITFYEFFEAFISCTEDSIRLKKIEEEFKDAAAQTIKLPKLSKAFLSQGKK